MKRPIDKRNLIMKLIKTVGAGLVIAISILILLCACESSKALDNNNVTESQVELTTKHTTDTKPTADNSTPVTTYPSEATPEEDAIEWEPDQADVEAIAKTLWGECRGVPYTSHKAAVVWCILNRVDEGGYFGSSIIEVVSKPNQFAGYDSDHPVDEDLAAIAKDVLIRWHAEKEGKQDVGRVLPKGYCYFVGDGKLNYFTNVWKSKNYWDWSLSNPYES